MFEEFVLNVLQGGPILAFLVVVAFLLTFTSFVPVIAFFYQLAKAGFLYLFSQKNIEIIITENKEAVFSAESRPLSESNFRLGR